MTRLGLAQSLEAQAAGLESQARALVAQARDLREAAAMLLVIGGAPERAQPTWASLPVPEAQNSGWRQCAERPQVREIVSAWSPIMPLTLGECWACRQSPPTRDGPLQRAHILAHCFGGSGEATNFHMLCKCCHLKSERLHGVAYWRWFAGKRGWSWPLEGGPA